MKNDESLVSVFTTNNFPLFEMAKSVLTNYKVDFFQRGTYLNNTYATDDNLEIKVSAKDAELARNLLSDLKEEKYNIAENFPKETKPYVRYFVIAGIIFVIAFMIIAFSLLK